MGTYEAEARRFEFALGVDHDEIDLLRLTSISGGESRTGEFTGTKALMLAVLEDAIRCYLGGKRLLAAEAECWINSRRRQSPFTFVVVCEALGLDPDSVRDALKRLKDSNVSHRKLLRRVRNNVRRSGRVCLRKSAAERRMLAKQQAKARHV